MIRIWACVIQTVPAELVLTDHALHVVAAFILLYLGPAYWAELDTSLLLGPPFEFALDSLFACLSLMPVISTHEADLCSALRTCEKLIVQCLPSCDPVTARFRTPSHEWVSFDLCVSRELLISLNRIRICLEQVPHFLGLHSVIACSLRTHELVELVLLDA